MSPACIVLPKPSSIVVPMTKATCWSTPAVQARFRAPAAIQIVVEQEIGAAQAGGADTDERVARSRHGRPDLEHFEIADAGPGLDQGTHGAVRVVPTVIVMAQLFARRRRSQQLVLLTEQVYHRRRSSLCQEQTSA